MLQIVIANPKGGCGKTTLASQLASYWSDKGYSVGLADHDIQQSALDWLKARPKACAEITPIAAFRGDKIPAHLDVVVHDMPAACSMSELEACSAQGMRLIIPVLPSPTDIKAGVRFLMGLNRQSWLLENDVQVALVANRVRANTNYYKTLVAFLEQVNMPLITSIRDTQNYIRAMDSGVSIFDLPPSRVKTDMAQWQDLLNWLEGSSVS